MNLTFYIVLVLTAVLAVNSYGGVRDIHGDLMFADSTYYVLPLSRGQGGGLTLAGRGGQTCPLDIVQESIELDEGIPVKFSNWVLKVSFVVESVSLNIETVIAATICVQSTYWWVDEFDHERGQYFVVTGSKPEGSREDSSKSFFRIEKSGEDAYKIVSCGGPKCSDVGIFVDEYGVRRLALSTNPFLVMFKKADGTANSSKTM